MSDDLQSDSKLTSHWQSIRDYTHDTNLAAAQKFTLSVLVKMPGNTINRTQ